MKKIESILIFVVAGMAIVLGSLLVTKVLEIDPEIIPVSEHIVGTVLLVLGIFSIIFAIIEKKKYHN